MGLITDKFGKASIDNNYAIATTVKTTRTIGVVVLEAFDLSKFNPDTPVFFVTYKKTTDPTTGVVSITNLVSWKGLVNVGANTLTNLIIAPGYTDTGNAVGDFIECISSSFWENSLIDGIFVGHNPDGTFKKSAVSGALNAPQGYLINGQIVRTVASNNLTIAIKGLDGNDPSATNPVYCRIGNTIRAITAALSVTKNAGTSWMNLGSTEHATQDVDLFAYLGYNATDGVTLSFSRIPHARIYSDFSATTTNEKYAAISTITNAAASDEYEIIGRFNATLGVTATFNWSIPATSIIVNRPIFESRLLVYQPGYSSSAGSFTTASAGGKYKIRSSVIRLLPVFNISINGTASGSTNITLPFTSSATEVAVFVGREQAVVGYLVTVQVSAASTNLTFLKYDNTYFGGNGYGFKFSGEYEL